MPLAITAVTAQELTATGATSVEDITQLSPGVTYTSFGAEANAQVIIRGVSDTSGGYSTSQNVSTFLDGIYIKNPSAIDLSLGGVDRVEIVKGPVSTTYGRNAFMGAVNYVTTTPGNTRSRRCGLHRRRSRSQRRLCRACPDRSSTAS